MTSKFAVYDTGYEDERFKHVVSQTLHCILCTNVIKDPVTCQRNEHLFCRACITIHLMYSSKCPTCMEPLTVETLRQAPRGIRNLLSELNIRCTFFDRGCGKFVQLGDLERHVADCGFAPAVCSNEGCQLEVNKQDLLHHETAVCELRRVKCHSCYEIRREMDTMKVNLAAMNEKFDRNEENVKAVAAEVKLVQQQLNKQEKNKRRLKADNVEIKKSLNEIMKQLERMIQQTSDGGINRDLKVVITGGESGKGDLNSVEMFSLRTGTWTPLQSMREEREGPSSAVYNNQLFVIGGWKSKSVEKLSLKAVQGDQSIPWENVPVELPEKLVGYQSVVHNAQLIVVGGYGRDRDVYSNSITEIPLVPPYTSKLLATMPQRRCYHGAAIFGNKILIVGGRESRWSNSTLKSVVMYDISKNKCQKLAPLPYPICEMATVKWGDYVMIMGGANSNNQPLNKVLMYNIRTQQSHHLPNMKYNRRGCMAAVVRDTVIVMGGQDEGGNCLKSVEGFTFGCNSWEELPPMNEARLNATAVAC